MASINWWRTNKVLHRDIGYLVAAMTIIYAISGIAVNHMEDWNPNYKIEKTAVSIDPVSASSRDEVVAEVLSKLALTEKPKNVFRPDPETLQLFFDQQTYSIDLPTGNVLIESVQPRRVLYELNQLHLNAPKRAWTYIADIFGVALMTMAITGMFMLKGKLGITGRGAWLAGLGLLLPVIYWLFHLNFS